jgi:hypothetical protein
MWIRLLPASQPFLNIGGDAFCEVYSIRDTTLRGQSVLIKYVLVQEQVFAPRALENSMVAV